MGLKTEASGLLMDPKNVQDAQEVPVHKDRLELVKNFLCIVLNVASAVGVVMANKVVFSVFNFKFGTVLTVIHFVVTAFALELLVALKAFPAKSVPIMTIVPLSLSFCGFVVLTNLSLQYNSVGFYQMAKVMTTPCVALIQYFFYSVSFTLPVIATLVVTCVGVIVATFAEVNLSPIGLFFAASSVLVTALYQIWVGSKQKELQLNAMQLLFYQAPVSAALLIGWVPVFDSLPELLHYDFSISSIFAIFLSSLCAVLVNVSTFLVIGRTSAITYNMVGHAKLSLVLLCGFVFFDGNLSVQNLLGVAVAFAGIISYSILTLSPKK